MMGKICIALIVHITFAFVVAEDKSCNLKKCPSIPKHYEELGCEAVKSEGDCCATSYKCPDLSARDKSKCHYKNQSLNHSEYLKSSALGGMCSAACYCTKGRDGKPAEFQCAHVDCPEYFVSHEPQKKCVRQYDKSHCCSIKNVCDDEVDKLSSCEFEGETYREGQAMYPKEHCYKCFCTKNFNNGTAVEANENCFKIECGISLRNVGRVMEGCIPVYYKRDNCCPIGWRCPGEKHMKVSTSTRSAIDLSQKCTFGKVEIAVGESLDLSDKCQKCTCTTPPMLHCIETC